MRLVSRPFAIVLASTLALSACDKINAVFNDGGNQTAHTYEGSPTEPVERHPGDPLFGVSPFPGGFSAAEANRGLRFAREESQVFTVQRDNGIPWKQALRGERYDRSVLDEWEIYRSARPKDMPLYLAIAPLNFDRETLINPLKGAEMPRELRNKPFDDPNVMKAYLNHVRTCVEFFDPDYLNIGLESGELSHRNPAAWPAFVRLFKHVRDGIKRDHPDVQIGISWGLQAMMEPEAAELSRSLVDASDFVGISFYPYMSEFHELFGSAPLPDPPGEWRVAFDWLREYTDKPIAICETGYNSKDAINRNPPLRLEASAELQAQYIKELAMIADRDDYLFVIYYFGTDIKNLIEAMGEAGQTVLLWQENGLIDSDFNPKPAYQVWKDVLRGEYTAEDIDESWATAPRSSQPATTSTQTPAGSADAAFAMPAIEVKDALQGPGTIEFLSGRGPDKSDAVRWEYEYSSDWAWAILTLDRGVLGGLDRIEGAIRSSRGGPIVVQFKEASGESFFASVNVTENWKPMRLDFASLTLDANTRQNGRFEPDQVNQIVFADGAGADGRSGNRRLFVTGLIGR